VVEAADEGQGNDAAVLGWLDGARLGCILLDREMRRAARRDLFNELVEGMHALTEARQGKRTLRTHRVEFKPPPEVAPAEWVRVRARLHLSRSLFATFLRTNPRTLENWSRGVSGRMRSTADYVGA
jgi:putative transcriptional regulator